MSTTLDLVHISRVDKEPTIEQLCSCRHIFPCTPASYTPHCGMYFLATHRVTPLLH